MLSAQESFQHQYFCVHDRLVTEMKRQSQIDDKISSKFSFLSGKVLCDIWKSVHLIWHDVELGIYTVELVSEIDSFKFQDTVLVKDIGTASHMDLL